MWLQMAAASPAVVEVVVVAEEVKIIIKACSHRVKANTEAKKIKKQSGEIKEKFQKLKEIFHFHVRFHFVWTDPKKAVVAMAVEGVELFADVVVVVVSGGSKGCQGCT